MANQCIKMQKLKKLIELTISGTAQRPISTILGIHRRTIVNYQGFLKSHVGGDLNLLLGLSEEELWRIVTLKDNPTADNNLFLLFPDFEKRLSHVGVTIRFLWLTLSRNIHHKRTQKGWGYKTVFMEYLQDYTP